MLTDCLVMGRWGGVFFKGGTPKNGAWVVGRPDPSLINDENFTRRLTHLVLLIKKTKAYSRKVFKEKDMFGFIRKNTIAKEIKEEVMSKIYSSINIFDLRREIAENLADDHKNSMFLDRDSIESEVSRQVSLRIIDEILVTKKQEIIDKISTEEFNEILKEGVKEKLKESIT